MTGVQNHPSQRAAVVTSFCTDDVCFWSIRPVNHAELANVHYQSPDDRLSTLEKLPAEILLPIFVLSENANLSELSPTLAWKLNSKEHRKQLTIRVLSIWQDGNYDEIEYNDVKCAQEAILR